MFKKFEDKRQPNFKPFVNLNMWQILCTYFPVWSLLCFIASIIINLYLVTISVYSLLFSCYSVPNHVFLILFFYFLKLIIPSNISSFGSAFLFLRILWLLNVYPLLLFLFCVCFRLFHLPLVNVFK